MIAIAAVALAIIAVLVAITAVVAGAEEVKPPSCASQAPDATITAQPWQPRSVETPLRAECICGASPRACVRSAA